MGGLWIHSTDITSKRSSEFKFWGEFGKSRDSFFEQIWSCYRCYKCRVSSGAIAPVTLERGVKMAIFAFCVWWANTIILGDALCTNCVARKYSTESGFALNECRRYVAGKYSTESGSATNDCRFYPPNSNFAEASKQANDCKCNPDRLSKNTSQMICCTRHPLSVV